MEPQIQLNHITKDYKILNRREGLKGGFQDLFSRDYKIVKAVNDLTMSISKGEMVGYLGPNGAGKSTAIKMMTGVLEPTSGEILINGKVPYKQRSKIAQEIGVVFGQRSQLWWALPVIESFKILKSIYQIDTKAYNDILEYYDSLIDARELYNKPVRQLSLGQRTLCDILAAFLHNPQVVFLDEPTIGLDVSMKSKIRELIKSLNKDKKMTVILTTHDMGDVDALCKRIIIIDKGIALYDNNIQDLRRFFGAYRTLKVKLRTKNWNQKKETLDIIAKELESHIKERFMDVGAMPVSVNEEWVDVLMNEDEISMMDVLNYIQELYVIIDMKLEEISTESIIMKIYEGGI